MIALPPSAQKVVDAASSNGLELEVREVTGYAIGGVPPFGHANPVRSFFDPALHAFDTIWAAAGTPRHVLPLSPAQLLDATGATEADFTE